LLIKLLVAASDVEKTLMVRWGKYIGLALISVGLSSTARADITIEVFPAYAPNGPDSPNWLDYVTNAISGIGAGGTNTGTGTRDSNPARYETIGGPISPVEMIYTPFKSWRGTAAPNPVFTSNAAVAGEFGNRVHFGTRILGTDGSTFRLEDLKWALDSDDDDNYFDQDGTFAGVPYSASRVGVNYGADGVPGGGDDTVYNNGEPGTNLVNELLYVGVGDGFPSDNIAAPNDQADIDLTLGAIFAGCDGCDVILKGSYMLGDAMGMGSVTISIPEPASISLASASILAGLACLRRRRRIV
jgi:hypothetical protein